jgi:hypothetical protein
MLGAGVTHVHAPQFICAMAGPASLILGNGRVKER